jgi:hypothetical protein
MRFFSTVWLVLALACANAPIETDIDLTVIACDEPESIVLANGDPSGYERCADGAVNRASEQTFDPTNTGPACSGDEESLGCATDAECTGGPNGRCIHGESLDGVGAYCGCEYACATDADCSTGQVCAPVEVYPGNTRPQCIMARCSTNADCASGQCGLSAYDSGCGWSLSLLCRDLADLCHDDADCDEACAVGEVEQFECVRATCDI